MPLNSPQPSAKMQQTNLQSVIDHSLRLLRPRLKPAAADPIKVTCQYGDLSAVECSADISQVFISLITQAIDALSAPADAIQSPQITIRTMQIPDPQGGNPRAVVCVADNGAEIPFEMQAQIFSPAASGARASSALSACYEVVVNQHGGDLQCYSQPGSTEFWVELPVKQLSSQPVQPPVGYDAAPVQPSKRLLYV